MNFDLLKENIYAYSDDEIIRVKNSWVLFHHVPYGYRPDHDYMNKTPITEEEYRDALWLFNDEARTRNLKLQWISCFQEGDVIKLVEGDFKVSKILEDCIVLDMGFVAGLRIPFEYHGMSVPLYI